MKQARGVQGLVDLAMRAGLAGLPANAGAPFTASAVDFVLEGLYAQKKISRTDERGYSAAIGSAACEHTSRRTSRRGKLSDPRREEEVLQLVKYRYSKYTGDPLEDLDLEDLVSKLSDLLLASGFFLGDFGLRNVDRIWVGIRGVYLTARVDTPNGDSVAAVGPDPSPFEYPKFGSCLGECGARDGCEGQDRCHRCSDLHVHILCSEGLLNAPKALRMRRHAAALIVEFKFQLDPRRGAPICGLVLVSDSGKSGGDS